MDSVVEQQRLLEMTVPGRYVLYPKTVSRGEAEKVLLQPSLTPVKFKGTAEIVMYGLPFQRTATTEDGFDIKPYNYRFECPELPNGLGLGAIQLVATHP
jgi:hypothetical protein